MITFNPRENIKISNLIHILILILWLKKLLHRNLMLFLASFFSENFIFFRTS